MKNHDYRSKEYRKLIRSPEAKVVLHRAENHLALGEWDFAIEDFKQTASVLGLKVAFAFGEIPEFPQRLRDYDFPEFQSDEPGLRNAFVGRWLWLELFQSTLFAPTELPVEHSLLATLLGHSYNIRIDFERLFNEYGWRNPELPNRDSSTFEERSKLCPSYPHLGNLNPDGRLFMVEIMAYNHRSQISSQTKFEPALYLDLLGARQECLSRGLVTDKLRPSDYLYVLTTNALRTILNEHGIQSDSATKADLINQITEALSQKQIRSYVSGLVKRGDLRLCFEGGRTLARTLWEENNRLRNWHHWLKYVHLAHHPDLLSRMPSNVSLQGRYFQNHAYLSPIYLNRPASVQLEERALKLVGEHWDSDCDEIVKDLNVRLGWNTPEAIPDAIKLHWGTTSWNQFNVKCEQIGWSAENLTRHFGELRWRELGITGYVPQVRTCLYCNCRFNEASIPPALAKRTGFRLFFCSSCLTQAWYGSEPDGRKGAITLIPLQIARLFYFSGNSCRKPQEKRTWFFHGTSVFWICKGIRP